MRRKVDKRMDQKTVPVRDRVAEVGINLNTIFTALVLAGIIWMGTTLRSIEKTLNDNAVLIAVMERDLKEVRTNLAEHKIDKSAHRK